MHIIVAIIAALLLIPAAVTGISQGLVQCSHHFAELASTIEQFLPLIETLTPFGLGLLWMLGGIGALALTAWLVLTSLHQAQG